MTQPVTDKEGVVKVKLDPLTTGRLKRAAVMVAVLAFALAAAILASELKRAWQLREWRAENDAKQHAGSMIQDGDLDGGSTGDFIWDEATENNAINSDMLLSWMLEMSQN